MGYWALHGPYKKFQGVIGGYSDLQGVTDGYRG